MHVILYVICEKYGTACINIFEHTHTHTHIHIQYTTQIPEMLGRFLNLNKMKTKRLSNHMSQYFIHNRT